MSEIFLQGGFQGSPFLDYSYCKLTERAEAAMPAALLPRQLEYIMEMEISKTYIPKPRLLSPHSLKYKRKPARFIKLDPNKYSSFSFFRSGSYRVIRGALCIGPNILKCIYERQSVCEHRVKCVRMRVWLCVIVCHHMCKCMSLVCECVCDSSVWECSTPECMNRCVSVWESVRGVWMYVHLGANGGWDMYFFWKQIKLR